MTSDVFLQKLTESSEEVQIMTLASMFFKIEDIALFIDRDEEEFRQLVLYKKSSPESKAYRRGVMQMTVKLRYETARFAIAGNPQAEDEMRQYYTRQKIDENA